MTSAAASPRHSSPPRPLAAHTEAERIATFAFARSHDVNVTVAREIANLITARAVAGKRCVLGLATGSTPTGIYAELIRLHR